MITNKDIRIENGNIILNGDKYPLDGQSPAAIMAIVEDNSDTTPTENSNNPVKSDGIKTYVDNAVSPTAIMAIVKDNSDTTPTENSTAPVTSGGVYTALTLHDNATEQQLKVYKNNNVVSIYGFLSNLDPTQTIIAYATLDEKYRPASGYAIGALISATAPYLPVGSVWVHGSTGLISVFKEAAQTDGYFYITYLT